MTADTWLCIPGGQLALVHWWALRVTLVPLVAETLQWWNEEENLSAELLSPCDCFPLLGCTFSEGELLLSKGEWRMVCGVRPCTGGQHNPFEITKQKAQVVLWCEMLLG